MIITIIVIIIKVNERTQNLHFSQTKLSISFSIIPTSSQMKFFSKILEADSVVTKVIN